MFLDPEQAPVELKQISVTSQTLIGLISAKHHYQDQVLILLTSSIVRFDT